MSRIHEALRKAERERAAQKSDEPAFVGREEMPGNSAAAAGVEILTNPSLMEPGAPRSSEFLRVDDLGERCAQVNWRLDPRHNVFMNSDPSTPGAEEFRTLRSRLYQLRGNQSLRTILVTSSVPGEGKTFTVTNLASAIIRQPGRRALIIDADLRRPRVHVSLGAPVAPGLAEYLKGEADEAAVIQRGQDSDLYLIPGGGEVTNPSELLSNGRLKSLLEHVSSLFDWVILDSPPCVPVSDASVLADMCDGLLLVVRSGSTPLEIARKAVQELQGKNIVGVVLNAVGKSDLYHGYYYYQGYGYGDRTESGATA